MDGHFFLGTRWDGTKLWVSLTGEFDRAAVGEVERALERAWNALTDEVVLDLRNVSFLDVAGLKLLLRARQAAGDRHLSMAIFRPRGHASRIFTLTRTGEMLGLVDHVDRVGTDVGCEAILTAA